MWSGFLGCAPLLGGWCLRAFGVKMALCGGSEFLTKKMQYASSGVVCAIRHLGASILRLFRLSFGMINGGEMSTQLRTRYRMVSTQLRTHVGGPMPFWSTQLRTRMARNGSWEGQGEVRVAENASSGSKKKNPPGLRAWGMLFLSHFFYSVSNTD